MVGTSNESVPEMAIDGSSELIVHMEFNFNGNTNGDIFPILGK